ncbi:ketosynthase chain-length factor [Streptomyces filamentosus]|uniref:Ketosynthase chain-length factor n=2 Tax=Streptomyces TaxID=1883 RepID=A0ABY4UV23_STRFL|nr:MULTISPECIES: beta-ketoacyl synthase N-terminal-like domain-containing protein [Streptomyces]USC48181.1 ketosynthase chain-length factor [Streptomyces filamentosus]
MSARRSVITGIGVVAPTGTGVAEHWRRTLERVGRIGPIDRFGTDRLPARLAGHVVDFDETEHIDSKLRVQTDRWTWLALAAGRLALDDAALDPSAHDPFDLSVVTASASGGNHFGQREIHNLWKEGPASVTAYQSIGWFYAASSGQLSIREQLKGACGVLVAEGAGGLDALAQARRLIARGTGAVVVGGTEAPLSPYAMACHASLSTLSDDPDPDRAYRPFAPDSTGQVLGEGGAMVVVEDAGWAAERKAPPPYAEVLGTASTHDAHHPAEPAPDHRQLARAIREATARAGLTADRIDVVFADGAGDRVRDRRETDALVEVFGRRGVPVAVPKTATGRLSSGGAALDLSWAALALAHDVVPPSVNLEATDADELDLVTEARRGTGLRTALVVARGAGGFNSAAVLGLPEGGGRRAV